MTEIPRINAPATDAARLFEATTQALTDGMVERLCATAANLLEVGDKLNEEDVRNGLVRTLDAVGQMHRAGALDTLVETVFLLHAVRSAATDSMVERFFAFMEHMVNNLGTEELATLAHETREALEDATVAGAKDTGGGLLATMRMLAQPETQQTLRFLMAFGSNLRQRTAKLSKE